uniref:RNA polymerase sigma factor n=1 Tax=Oryza brachyantha TaxID=4533 RepID=J3LME6_ORYBR
MACLAPQFKWPPSTRAASPAFREHTAGGGGSGGFRAVRLYCAVSTTTLVEAEISESLAAGAVALPPHPSSALPGGFGEAILNQAAVVAAAAAEAVALARAAAEVAGEVARMAQTDQRHRPDFVTTCDTEDNYLAREILRAEVGSRARYAEDAGFSSIFSDESEIDDDEQCIQGVAVKSVRQSERRARRVRAAMKSAKSFSCRNSVAASSRKKRLKGCRSPLGCFYKMTGRRLLTAKQEVEFSQGIQDLLKLEAIQKELAHYSSGEPTFSQWAEAAGTDENALRKRLNYGIYCKNTMVKSNVRLVISIAREFEGPGMEFSDLIQEGIQGLVRGAEKFDASKGFRFSTYSHWWIKQAIRKSVLEQTQIIRLPAHMAEASSRVKECQRRLRRQLKRLPTNEEIASDTGLPLRRVEAAMSLPKYSVSLTGKVGCTDMTYQEITPDTSAETAEQMLHRWLMKKDVDMALDGLSPRERQVIRYRFGMDDGRLRTLHDTGKLMGVSRERIRQIELGAFRKLRGRKTVQSLQHYLQPVESW